MTLATWEGDNGTLIALNGSEGVSVMRGVRGLDGPPIRNTLDARIGDGSVRVNSRRPERPFLLPLLVDTDTISVNTVISTFQSGKLVANSGRELRSVVYEDGFEGQWSIESGGVVGLSHRKFSLSLVALDPFWYGDIDSQQVTFGTGTAWNGINVPWNADLPWNGGASVTVFVAGDNEVPCRVVVLAGASPVTEVTFEANGVGWVATGIDAGDAITVDSRPGKRGPYEGASLLGITESPVDWGLLTEGSQPFMLLPGENTITFGYVSAAAPTAWIWWEPRWLAP